MVAAADVRMSAQQPIVGQHHEAGQRARAIDPDVGLDRRAFLQQFDFSGKTVGITGAASGIGKASALLFHTLGAHVVLADRDHQALDEISRSIPSDRLRTVAYDQADFSSFDALMREMGTLDVFVNNAGMLLAQSIQDTSDQALLEILHINLGGAIALSRRAAAAMMPSGKGVILHTGSQMGFTGAAQRAAYAATKAAITQFVKTAALEWAAQGIRVNGVAPGRTMTPINRHLLDDPQTARDSVAHVPLGRLGATTDMANAFVFLASDAAAYITGHMLLVDGGWVLV